MVTSDDIRVGVVNEGPLEPTWFYDQKPYQYRVSTPEMIRSKRPLIRWIPLKIAYEHWAIELRDGKLERATGVKPQDEESQLENRLAGICPKKFYTQKDAEGNPIRNDQGRTLGAYADDADFKDWFMNKVHFKLKRIAEYEEELGNG